REGLAERSRRRCLEHDRKGVCKCLDADRDEVEPDRTARSGVQWPTRGTEVRDPIRASAQIDRRGGQYGRAEQNCLWYAKDQAATVLHPRCQAPGRGGNRL